MPQDWKQMVVVELLDKEGETTFRADVPLEIVEEHGEHIVAFAGAEYTVGTEDELVLVVSLKDSNAAGRAMTRRALPPDEVLNGPPDA